MSITQIKESVAEFKNEISKFMKNPYHSIKYMMNLQNKLTRLEKNLSDKEKDVEERKDFNSVISGLSNENINSAFVASKLISTTNHNPVFLPILKKNEYGEGLASEGGNFNTQKNKIDIGSIHHIRKRLPENPIIEQRKAYHKDKISTEQVLSKYGLNKNSSRQQQLINEYEDKSSKIQKRIEARSLQKPYNRVSGHRSYRKQEYNNYNKPIIVREDFDKGLYEMINQGLIPKNADLTMAFSRNGNPFKLDQEDFDKFDRKPDQIYNNINVNININCNPNEIGDKEEAGVQEASSDYQNIFITNNQQDLANKKMSIQSLIAGISRKQGAISNTEVAQEQPLAADSEDFKFIKFVNFKVLENKEFSDFKLSAVSKWSSISYMIYYLEKIFKNLNVVKAEVDCNKLRKLSNDELQSINKLDLINCLSEKDLRAKGFNKPSQLFMTVKDSAARIIQKHVQSYMVRKKFRQDRGFYKKVCKIQTIYRLFRLIKISKSLVEENLRNEVKKWNMIMSQFKSNWKEIRQSKRIEIHINSLSYSSIVNCTISKFNERQNNQMTRLIALLDPNVEIIYVSSYEIPDDVINYYVSILSTLGINNVKERIHFVVPDTAKLLPSHFSLTSLLLFSTSSCQKIMKLIKNRIAYIVPGTPSTVDMRLSMYLECPILYTESEASATFFTKSGAKRVFELCDLAIPIGEWNICNKENLYAKLASLITTYPSINVWIFKIDDEFYGRGIAYLQLDRLKHVIQLKKERQQGNMTKEKFESNLNTLLKTTMHKKLEIVSKLIYHSGDEYLNEFVKRGGIIEACPTLNLSGITGSPAISFLIEPDGSIRNYISYDKISSRHFKSVCSITPQSSIVNLVRNKNIY